MRPCISRAVARRVIAKAFNCPPTAIVFDGSGGVRHVSDKGEVALLYAVEIKMEGLDLEDEQPFSANATMRLRRLAVECANLGRLK